MYKFKKIKMKKIVLLFVTTLFVISCSTVPITGRKRLNLVKDEQVLPASFAQYQGFLKQNKLSSNASKSKQVKDVGARISYAVDKFMRANGMVKEANSYKWEFNLVADNKVNAWCLPGGKVVFYEGILPICANEDGVAAVMGHEVAHAFAKHGQERMTAAYGQKIGAILVAVGTAKKDPRERQMWNMVYGLGSNLGMLKYSRVHETEADRLGMVFMIMAGYNPEEAINVWIRMSKRSESRKAPPQFLSTHPSNQTRVRDLRAYLPTAVALAKKYSAVPTSPLKRN